MKQRGIEGDKVIHVLKFPESRRKASPTRWIATKKIESRKISVIFEFKKKTIYVVTVY